MDKLKDKQLLGLIFMGLGLFLLGVFAAILSIHMYENENPRLAINYIVTPGNYTIDVGSNIRNMLDLKRQNFTSEGKVEEVFNDRIKIVGE